MEDDKVLLQSGRLKQANTNKKLKELEGAKKKKAYEGSRFLSVIGELVEDRKKSTGDEFLNLSQRLLELYDEREQFDVEIDTYIESLQAELHEQKLTAQEERVVRGWEALRAQVRSKNNKSPRPASDNKCVVTDMQPSLKPRPRRKPQKLHAKRSSYTPKPSDKACLPVARFKEELERQLQLARTDNQKYETFLPLCKRTPSETKVLADMYEKRTDPKGIPYTVKWPKKQLHRRISLMRRICMNTASVDEVVWEKGRNALLDEDVPPYLLTLPPHARKAAILLESLSTELTQRMQAAIPETDILTEEEKENYLKLKALFAEPKKKKTLPPLPEWKYKDTSDEVPELFSHTVGASRDTVGNLQEYDKRLRLLRRKIADRPKYLIR